MDLNTIYPNISDPLFSEKIAALEEYGIFEIESLNNINNIKEFIDKADSLCQFEKTRYQHLVSQYISPKSPYNGILLYHGLGSGKTCSAITIAEGFIKQQRTYSEPNIWIISKKGLKKSFEQEIFKTTLLLTPEYIRSQCTNDTYYKLIPNADQLDTTKLNKRIQQVIKSRYKFFGYEKFANTIENYIKEGILKDKIKDKVIIIDEAHNIRYLDTFTDTENSKEIKKIVEPLIKVLKEGKNNRLVLLSATPMYNEPEEILWLLSLLTLNDNNNILDPYNIPQIFDSKNKEKKEIIKIIADLSSKYISYVRGNNPFTFAIRINPKLLDIPVLNSVPKYTIQNNEIEDTSWIQYIKDGLIPSEMRGVQLDNMNSIIENNSKLSIAALRQMSNVTYKKQLTNDKFEYVEGKKGLFTVFTKKDDSIPIKLKYLNKAEQIFNPAFELLQDYSCKLYTISNLIKKSKGIVVIYSNFIWSGIIPTAIVLEHMGFSRYGDSDILSMRGKVTEQISYKNINNPKYCILSNENEKEIMGKTKIDELLSIINSNENINGENIKVVLMSPVASEGLTFKNIREIHILEPWYHLNTSEQAIGRAIRNCSHSSLPVEKRNVSVLLHTCVLPNNNIETEDLHAYRISAIKYNNIEKINKIIKENALDCNLLKNINYFPRDLFKFTSSLELSNGKVIPYHYGDDTNMDIKCSHTKKLPIDVRNFREDSYHNFIPTLQNKLIKKLKDNYKVGITKYTYEELIDIIHKNKELAHRTIEETLYPYKLWSNYYLIFQYDNFYVSSFKNSLQVIKPVRLQIEKEEEIIADNKECNLPNILQQFMNDDEYTAIIHIYQSIDYNCWKLFCENMVLNSSRYSYIDKIINILEKQGSFILANELPNIKNVNNSKYIGYVNIFSKEDKFEVILWDTDDNQFREATPQEIKKIINNRRKVPFIDLKKKQENTQAFIKRYENIKNPSKPVIFQIKLLFADKENTKGIVCDTVKKDIIEKEFNKVMNTTKLDDKYSKLNKYELCFQLILELLKKNKVWIPPMYKI